jgi:hypothetical protein
MALTDIYVGLGLETFTKLLKGISIGKLRTYKLFERFRVRCRIIKLNQEGLKKVAPKLWDRLADKDQELASDLAQAILVSHLDMLVAVLDSLEIKHTDGFFEKDADVAGKLTEGWQAKVYASFNEQFPQEILVFYLNHLAQEVAPETPLFLPAKP